MVVGFDFDVVVFLFGSFVCEFDDFFMGFNVMVSGLKVFGWYVLKMLVFKLIFEG